MDEQKYIAVTYQNGVAYFVIGEDESAPYVNSLLLDQLEVSLKELLLAISNGNIIAVIFYGSKRSSFFAGFSSQLLMQLRTEAQGMALAERVQFLFNMIEDISVPTFALLQGKCEALSFELALACRYRLSFKDTLFSLPYIHWGLSPMGGSSYRLPRLIGLKECFNLLIAGEEITSSRAQEWGIVDQLMLNDNWRGHLEQFITIIKNQQGGKEFLWPRKAFEFLTQESFLGKKFLFHQAKERWLHNTRGLYQAPLKILELLETSQGKGRSTVLHQESMAFGLLCVSEQSQNLRYIQQTVTVLKEIPLKNTNRKNEHPSWEGRIGVMGIGTIGAGIALTAIQYGHQTVIKDKGRRDLEAGLKRMALSLERQKFLHIRTPEEVEIWKRRLVPTLNYNGLKQCRLIIESIDEDLAQKKVLLSEIEKVVEKECLIVSSTSSLSIGELATALQYPGRFLGMQFFYPVERVQLVELVTHHQVKQESIYQLWRLAKSWGKVPILVKDAPGFLVNRLLMPLFSEAIYLLEEGVSVTEIDRACRHFGLAVGPLRLMDEIGMDLVMKVAQIFYEAFGGRVMLGVLADGLVNHQILGKKNRQGFYLYQEDGRAQKANPLFHEIFPKRKREYDEKAIQRRLIIPMINEAAHILDEGLVEKSSTIDVASVLGIGFPAFRGGILKYGENIGLKYVLNQLRSFESELNSERFRPAKLLIRLVEEGKVFQNEEINL